uniref:AGC-kinase C-terminal domain-containing protein n=1 Tax=Anisakis simplex TaxID=6269 RepID=A0A0M3JI71_ANISI
LMTFGSASWRLSTSLSSAAPQARQSSAAYSPMSSDRPNVNSLDIPLPETRVDWERQFFDEDVYSHPVWDPSNVSFS